MAEIATKPKAAVSRARTTHQVEFPTALSVVDRTTELSEDVLRSLEAGERAAVEAVGQFVITIEEALSQEVAGTSDVAKKITESGLVMADRLIQTLHGFLRGVIDGAAKSMSSRNGAVHPAQ
ncbi:MAG: hypothetical protein ABSG43_09270 [Solirubrobacteraceae bacterium]|jgi:hypothetical protein